MNCGVVRNALTVDFEDWYHGLEIPIDRWAVFEDRIEEPSRRLLDLFDAAGVKATFFVLGHVAERHPDLVAEIARRGHEIGTHGFSHNFIYRQSPDEFGDELHRSLGMLQRLAGAGIVGYRAPFFSVTQQSLWAFEVMAAAGIRYDSSIFPVLNYRYGIADAPRWPHEIAAGDGRILEFPLSTVRLFGKNIPVAGGAYFRIYPYVVTRAAFRAINSQGRPAVFYMHPWEIDPRQPRIPLPRRIALTHYFRLDVMERRLRRLLRDFAFAPMKEVLGVG